MTTYDQNIPLGMEGVGPGDTIKNEQQRSIPPMARPYCSQDDSLPQQTAVSQPSIDPDELRYQSAVERATAAYDKINGREL